MTLTLITVGLGLIIYGACHERFVEWKYYSPELSVSIFAGLLATLTHQSLANSWAVTVITAPLTVVLYMVLLPKKYTATRRNKAVAEQLPKPPCFLPHIGHAIQLAAEGGNLNKILNFIDKFFSEVNSRIFCLKIFGKYTVFLREPDDLEVVLGSMKHIEKGPEYSLLEPWLRKGLLTSTGDKWRLRRKLLTPSFHLKILGHSMEALNRNSRVLVESLLAHNGQPVDCGKLISLCALDVIGETAMGVHFNFQRDTNSPYLNAIKKVSGLATERIVRFWQYKPLIYYCIPSGWSFYKALKSLHAFSEQIIGNRKETFKRTVKDEDGAQGKKPCAFLDCLLELNAADTENLMDDTGIREEVDTFMFEGHDTTSAALQFSLLLLGNHQHIQEAAYREQMSIFGGSSRDSTHMDLGKMKYLEQVIKEVLRLYPSVPVLSRFLTEDVDLDGGIKIPSQASLVFSPYFTHRITKYFPDPEVFDPERFSKENTQGRHPYAYIPFSAGPRNCIGQKFAMVELKTVLSTLLRFSRIESVTKVSDVQLLVQLILKTAKPIIVKVYPRDSVKQSI